MIQDDLEKMYQKVIKNIANSNTNLGDWKDWTSDGPAWERGNKDGYWQTTTTTTTIDPKELERLTGLTDVEKGVEDTTVTIGTLKIRDSKIIIAKGEEEVVVGDLEDGDIAVALFAAIAKIQLGEMSSE